MKELVLTLDVHDCTKCKNKAMKIAALVEGVNSITLDVKEKKLTVRGSMDPVKVVGKLRKVYFVRILAGGPANEPYNEPTELAASPYDVYVDRSERGIPIVNGNAILGPCLCGVVQIQDCFT